jgi:hypothetical protein
VEQLGGRFVATAGFARDEHRGLRGGEFLELRDEPFHLLAFAEEPRFEISGLDRRDGAALALTLHHGAAKLEPPLQRVHELIDLEGLLQVVEGAELQRLDRALRAGVGRHDDDDGGRIERLELFEQRDAVHRLHVDVGEHEVVFFGLVAGQALLAVGRKRGLVTGRRDDGLEHLVDRDQVIDNEEGGHEWTDGKPASPRAG